MKAQLKRKRGKIQKTSEEVEETTPPVRKAQKIREGKDGVKVVIERKPRGKEVNDKLVVVESNSNSPKTREKISRPKKNNVLDNVKENCQILIHDAEIVASNLDKEVDEKEGDDELEDEKEGDDDEYRLEDEQEEDEGEDEEGDDDEQEDEEYNNETSDSNSSSESIEYEKPYYGGRKKLPPRAAATQRIDYSDNRYFHEFQDYFFARLDDDSEPTRRKSLSTPTRESSTRKSYSDDDYYSNASSSSQDNLRSAKRPRRKRLPNRESKEKSIDYSENKYYRQFDSKVWTDKLSDDESDSDTNKKKGSSNGKVKKSTPVSTSQKTSKISSGRSNRYVHIKTPREIINSSEEEQVSDQMSSDGKARGRNTVE